MNKTLEACERTKDGNRLDEILGDGVNPQDYSLPTFVDISQALVALVNPHYQPTSIHAREMMALFRPKEHSSSDGHIYLFIFADAFGENIRMKLPDDFFMKRHFVQLSRAIFPSSTPCCMTSLFTGLYPCDHGVVGRTYLKEHNIVATPLNFVDFESRKKLDESGITIPQLFPKPVLLPESTDYFFTEGMHNPQLDYEWKKRKSEKIKEKESATKSEGEPNEHEEDNPRFHYYWDLDDCAEKIIDFVHSLQESDKQQKMASTAEKPCEDHLIVVYWDVIDNMEHRTGMHTQETENALKDLEKFLASLEKALTQTTIVVTADHGHTPLPFTNHVDWDWPPAGLSEEVQKLIEDHTAAYEVRKEKYQRDVKEREVKIQKEIADWESKQKAKQKEGKDSPETKDQLESSLSPSAAAASAEAGSADSSTSAASPFIPHIRQINPIYPFQKPIFNLFDTKEELQQHLSRVDRMLSLLRTKHAGGDRRCGFFYCIDGEDNKLEFKKLFTQEYGDKFVLMSVDEVDELRLFGPTPLSPFTKERMGDWVCLPKGM
eukprot:MONOS_6583.2-p1 / transcript=MONOS_6583.2 / gene=MONOS_6583 / organism=Monocercomonoides_exilis_PA203 / gene_product=unspecified product / transcript_product=unspecified product / location=Mono_scaffold00210:13110-15270(-) / protein_length=546 / sequence_SO=supercontig / SO=protein_coding / is_pseudo=false